MRWLAFGIISIGRLSATKATRRGWRISKVGGKEGGKKSGKHAQNSWILLLDSVKDIKLRIWLGPHTFPASLPSNPTLSYPYPFLSLAIAHLSFSEYNADSPLPSVAAGWITAMFSLGCIVGSMPSGALTDFLGRKKCIILLSFIFSVGAIIQLVPRDYAMLLAGRFLSGIGASPYPSLPPSLPPSTPPSRPPGFSIICLCLGCFTSLALCLHAFLLNFNSHCLYRSQNITCGRT